MSLEFARSWRSFVDVDLQNTPGLTDVYEFGVFSGNSTAELSVICDARGLTCNHIVGFDSFDGIPKETAEPSFNAVWDPERSSYHKAFNSQSLFGVHSPEEAMNKIYSLVRPHVIPSRRLTLVPGFYENSLTDELPEQLGLKKAIIVDIDCDIYSSAKTVLSWLFKHKLVDVGTYVYYDDWAGTPNYKTMGDGESRAHREITEQYKVEWELVGTSSDHVPDSQVIWKIKSIG